MSSLEHDPIYTGFLSFFPLLLIFGKWQASTGSYSWYDRKEKQSEIKILEEQLARKQDLGNGITAYFLPPPLPYPSLHQSAGTEEGKTDGSKGQTLSLQALNSLAQYSLSGAES